MGPSAIHAVQASQPLAAPQALRSTNKDPGGFVKMVSDFAREVDQAQQKANEDVARLAAGKTDNVHKVMLSLGKAEISFDYLMEVRSRLLEAYKEVMRMPV